MRQGTEPMRQRTETRAPYASTAPLGGAASPGPLGALDYFRTEKGVTYAGAHLLLDLWDCADLDDPVHVRAALCEAAQAAGATILYAHTHHFSPHGGVSGVVVLAESHISIHTWPERGFAAVDVFMCGACDPKKTLGVLRGAFNPSRIDETEARRGVVMDAGAD